MKCEPDVTYRFLAPADLPLVRETFNAAFSDYFVDSQLGDERLVAHLRESAVRLELSVGACRGMDMVGLLLNGIDAWDGALTAYDAGTGVVPAFRGRGIAGGMFRFALPGLEAAGVRRCLLEVIRENEPAIKAYRALGFTTTRELQCFRRPAEPLHPTGAPAERAMPELRIHPSDAPDWGLWSTFWDWQPSWQNSPGSIARAGGRCALLTASAGGRCAGYVAFAPGAGRILQIGVAPDARRRGVASRLLRSVRAQVADDRDLTIINVDASAAGTISFLRAGGFLPTIGQYEMAREL